MQELHKLTLGASKTAYCAGDDFPRGWERAWGGVFRGGESERAGIAPSPFRLLRC